MTPESVRSKLWREAADKHLYVILDGAQNENLLDVMFEAEGLQYECLMTDELEPDMQEVAPYIVELVEDAPFTKWLMADGWAQNWGIFLSSACEFDEVWRDVRQHVEVLGPNKQFLYFRFYDPRVLNAFLPTCDGKQLKRFFGLVDKYFAEVEGGGGLKAYSLADGELVTELVGAT